MAKSSNDKINALFSWCVHQTKNYKNVNITNFTSSWRNGLGFCAILHRYAPEFIDYESFKPENALENCQTAFQIAEKQFGIPALLNAKDMATMKSPDRLSIITYLLQYYSTLASKRPRVPSLFGNSLTAIENISDEHQTEDNIVDSSSTEECDQLICELCSEVIYFLEKLSVNDKYYHRSCYRATQLSNLKARNRTLERPSAAQLNKSNIGIDSSHRKSRIHSLSPDARDSISSRSEKSEPVTQQANGIKRIRSRSKSLSADVTIADEINRSNTGQDNNNLRLRLRSLSPPSNVARPPSFDVHLEKRSLENSPSKSLRQFTTDRSSPSGSSTHYVSINASSTDSLPKSFLGTADSSNGDPLKKPSSKLYPGSLNTSSSSLNSSFGKKRRAPPPPATIPNRNAVQPKTIPKLKNLYPEDLNPFAEFGDDKPQENETNPFAEYMTEPSSPDKSEIKPKKRPAPKIPPKPVMESQNHEESSLNRVTCVSEHDLSPSLPGLPEFSENENPPTSQSKETNETSIDSSSTSAEQPELKHENTQTSESIIRPEPLRRTKPVKERAKSNDCVNLLFSSRNSKQKPPAPSRPVPQKREVRGDTSHEFIPYESLYSELEEVNKKQSELEVKGRSLQDALKEVNEKDGRYEALLQEWLDIVEKKNAIYSKEHHLHEILRRQELEDRHSDLEFELRVLMGKQESLKTVTEKAREEELINQILDTVNARAQLTEEDVETFDKAASNEMRKKKSSLKKIFSCKHRSSSLGKTIFRTKTSKTLKKP